MSLMMLSNYFLLRGEIAVLHAEDIQLLEFGQTSTVRNLVVENEIFEILHSIGMISIC
jgi:hypothetical protein